MITNVLIEHPWLPSTALVLLVAFGPYVGSRLVTRPAWAWSLTGLSLVPVAILTMAPVDNEPFVRCAVKWTFPTLGRVELLANVVLFVAPVLLAGVASRRPLLVLAAASALSFGLETVQALSPAIGRSCDTNDWMSNTIGAVIGAALAWVAMRLRSTSTPPSIPSRWTTPLGPSGR